MHPLGSLKIAALAGGVGAARLLSGMVQVTDPPRITAIVNTGDDAVLHGMNVSPDLDTVTYTLAGIIDRERGWGLSNETWNAMEALAELGGATWFRLGDRDIALHMFRTDMINKGMKLSEVTDIVRRHYGIPTRILPMSDDPVRTILTLADAGKEIGFQEYFVKLSHSVPVSQVRYLGATEAAAAPGVIDALADAEVVVICPSNPFLSIFPILALPGVRQAITRDNAIAISPIIAGKAIKGPADRLLRELGMNPTATGVAELYRDIAATIFIDSQDTELRGEIESLGMRCIVTNTVMSDQESSKALASASIAAALLATGNMP